MAAKKQHASYHHMWYGMQRSYSCCSWLTNICSTMLLYITSIFSLEEKNELMKTILSENKRSCKPVSDKKNVSKFKGI